MIAVVPRDARGGGNPAREVVRLATAEEVTRVDTKGSSGSSPSERRPEEAYRVRARTGLDRSSAERLPRCHVRLRLKDSSLR